LKISRRIWSGVGAVVVLLVLVPMLYRWWSFHREHVTTDNAYVRADISLVTPRVPGVVSEVLAQENQPVVQGTPLVRLDRADFEVKLRQADAALASAREAVAQRRAAVFVADSAVRLAEAQLAQARLDDTRASRLSARDAAPAERVEKVHTALAAAEAQLDSAHRAVEQARAVLGIAVDAPADEAAIVRQALAVRDEASLALSYTELRAPTDGVIAKRSAEVGQAVQPGQPLMMLVPLDKVFIEANFKESQLADVRVGQPVSIVADLYPDLVYEGHVASLAPGSGAAFALLPPENASGNWVKVVQRVPVRVALDGPPRPDSPLRVGTSVVASIDIRSGDDHQPVSLTQSDRTP
jgi:membrane fusion protein, multidrug efflux system